MKIKKVSLYNPKIQVMKIPVLGFLPEIEIYNLSPHKHYFVNYHIFMNKIHRQ